MNAPVKPGFRVAASLDAAEAVLADDHMKPIRRAVHDGLGLQVWFRGGAVLGREPMPGLGLLIWVPDDHGDAAGPEGHPDLVHELARASRVLLSSGPADPAEFAHAMDLARPKGAVVVIIEARPDELPEWRTFVLQYARSAVLSTNDPDGDVLAVAKSLYEKAWRDYQQGVPGAGERVTKALDAVSEAQRKQSSR